MSKIIDLKLDTVDCKAIPNSVAQPFVKDYHYSHLLPSNTQLVLGYYVGTDLIGVISFGIGSNRNQLPWMRKIDASLTWENFFELTRLCIRPDMHVKNLASRMIRLAFDFLRIHWPKKQIILSYADVNQVNTSGVSHIGYIYQATNWYYLGESKSSTLFYENGILKHHRALKGAVDSQKHQVVNVRKKHKYLYLLCDKKLKRTWLPKIKVYPYPKQIPLVQEEQKL